jgi:hypothetical protein
MEDERKQVVSPSTELRLAEERMLGRTWSRRWSRGGNAARDSSDTLVEVNTGRGFSL